MSKILYLDPFSGIAGDMFLGLLIDLGIDISELKKELDKLKVNYSLNIETVNKNGIKATGVDVIVPEEIKDRNEDMNLREIKNILNRLERDLKTKSIEMFDLLAEIESEIHDVPKEEMHFHEVGAIDAIIEIVGAIKGLQLLGVDKMVSGNVNTGSGFVDTEHGKYPVPAPATAELLKGVPVNVSEDIQTELVTPTGALILKKLVDDYDKRSFSIERIGYGAGDRDLEIPNVLRGYLTDETSSKSKENILVETNIDDMNPEIFGYLMDKLFEAGALDVYYTPIFMKKNRPAYKLSILCSKNKKDDIIKMIMKESTSIGVRIHPVEKFEANREIIKVKTEMGSAKVKVANFGMGELTLSPEYDSCVKLAEKNQRPLKYIYDIVRRKAEDMLLEEEE